MNEITILSGKGGAGKTSITAAIASLAKNAVFCDNDVDAADLHLIFKPQKIETHTFHGSWLASVNENKCTKCGICENECRFDAIHFKADVGFYINPYQCEGCRLCERLCPSHAITSTRSDNNFWFVSNTRFGKMVHAQMGPGEENSGKLVTQVRNKAKEIAKEINAKYIINDGPPGIGCSAISSITGANTVILVIEPTKSGLHDIQRLVNLTRSFDVKLYAIINKVDISEELTCHIITYLSNENIPLIAAVPFDKQMVEAMICEKSIIEYAPDSIISKQIRQAWEIIQN